MNDTEKLNYYESEVEKFRAKLAAAKNPQEVENWKVELEAAETSVFMLKRKLGLLPLHK